jgi:hypothetical protein
MGKGENVFDFLVFGGCWRGRGKEVHLSMGTNEWILFMVWFQCWSVLKWVGNRDKQARN